MQNQRPIHLSYQDFKKLEHKQIGSGTDGIVYKYNSKYLIKIYRKNLAYLKTSKELLAQEMKIYQKGDYKNYEVKNDLLQYFRFQDEDIQIRPKEAILYAMKRQKEITKTYLPQNRVYIDHHFVGCLLKRIYGIPIHYFELCKLETKQKIAMNLLEIIDELITHYIYPIDINNSPFCNNYYYNDQNMLTVKKGHSHVLIQPFTLDTKLIDLEGHSTIYTERRNSTLEARTLRNCLYLLIEFLYHFDIEKYEDGEEIYEELESRQVPYQFQHQIVSGGMTIPEMKEFIRTLKK